MLERWPYAKEPEEIKVGWRTITKKTFTNPGGNKLKAYTKDKIGNRSVAVVALTVSNMVVVNEMFRLGPEKIMYELPGGGVDKGENLQDAAMRELQEETGYSSYDIEYLGKIYKDAWSNSENHYFLARNSERSHDQKLDKEEFIMVKEIPIAQLFENARSSLITDTGAVFLAYDKLRDIEKEG